MKIVINYDFINKMKLLNDRDSKLTLIKCCTNYWLKKYCPIFLPLDAAVCFEKPVKIITLLGIQYLITLLISEFEYNHNGCNFATKSELEECKNKIYDLSAKLQDLNISTSYELLLRSEEYYKETKFVLNDYHLPELMSRKFIKIHAYNDERIIKEISIEQEHIIGSKQYVLTLGSPNNISD